MSAETNEAARRGPSDTEHGHKSGSDLDEEDQTPAKASPIVRTVTSASIGPLSERTTDARFHDGGVPGRAVGDTLFSTSGLYAEARACLAVKATFGTSCTRSNGDEFSAELTETVTFREGSTLVLRGRANLSAFERRDAQITLEVVEATGALSGWYGCEITSRTDGPPSQSRSTRFELRCDDPRQSGSGPDEIIGLTEGVFDRILEAKLVDIHGGTALELAPCWPDDSDMHIAGALYVVAEANGHHRLLYGSRLPAHMLPTGGRAADRGSVVVAGFLVRPTPRAVTRRTVQIADLCAHPTAVAVTVPQAGGPELTQPLDDARWISWGVDRGELELVPLGPIGRVV